MYLYLITLNGHIPDQLLFINSFRKNKLCVFHLAIEGIKHISYLKKGTLLL